MSQDEENPRIEPDAVDPARVDMEVREILGYTQEQPQINTETPKTSSQRNKTIYVYDPETDTLITHEEYDKKYFKRDIKRVFEIMRIQAQSVGLQFDTEDDQDNTNTKPVDMEKYFNDIMEFAEEHK